LYYVRLSSAEGTQRQETITRCDSQLLIAG
jgi:hypothetical protein